MKRILEKSLLIVNSSQGSPSISATFLGPCPIILAGAAIVSVSTVGKVVILSSIISIITIVRVFVIVVRVGMAHFLFSFGFLFSYIDIIPNILQSSTDKKKNNLVPNQKIFQIATKSLLSNTLGRTGAFILVVKSYATTLYIKEGVFCFIISGSEYLQTSRVVHKQ